MADSKQAVVIDNGSDLLKAGIAGEEEPSVSFATVVGRPRAQSAANKKKKDDTTYVGVETSRDLSIKVGGDRALLLRRCSRINLCDQSYQIYELT